MTEDLFNKLRAHLAKHLPDPSSPLAVGVSGGADSLALVVLLHQAGYCVTALTVDHGLRSEAADEALHVQKLMIKMGIDHHILTVSTLIEKQNLQAKAREVRYQLLVDWCCRHQIHHLCAAHHQEDQAETFLLRLARGSGVKGLQAMQTAVRLSENLVLHRPLLLTPKQMLKDFLSAQSIQWIEDPSNQNDDFDRIKIRDFLNRPPLDGFTAERLGQTAATMQRAQQALDFYTDQWLENHADFDRIGCVTLKRSGLGAAPVEIIFRALSQLIIHMTGKAYAPRFQRLLRLYDDIQKKGFQTATLGGVVFANYDDETMTLYREYAAMAPLGAVPICRYEGIFNLKFSGALAEGDKIAPLGKAGWVQVKTLLADHDFWSNLPHSVRLTIPVIWAADGRVKAAPYIKDMDVQDMTSARGNQLPKMLHISVVPYGRAAIRHQKDENLTP